MKCLHILPMNKLSGAEKMVLTICKNMNKYQPIVVCGGLELENIFKENGIKGYSINFSSKNLLKISTNIKNIIKENDIRIIHAHDNIASIIAYITKRVFNLQINIVSHIHSCYPWLSKNGFNKFIDKNIRGKYDYNIACGKGLYDFYKKNADYIDEKKFMILSNAIDIKEVEELNLKNSLDLKKQYNIPNNKIVLGFIGRLCSIKGIIPFLKEAAKYKEQLDDCRILLIGSGDEEEDIKKLVIELGIQDIVIMTGFQKDTYKFYQIIDVFFLPSLYEGLPMVILEAMAFKKAVISMDVGSINDVIEDKKTGLLIKPNQFNEFVNNLIILKNNKNFQLKLGHDGFEYLKKNLDINSYVTSLEKCYDKLLLNI